MDAALLDDDASPRAHHRIELHRDVLGRRVRQCRRGERGRVPRPGRRAGPSRGRRRSALFDHVSPVGSPRRAVAADARVRHGAHPSSSSCSAPKRTTCRRRRSTRSTRCTRTRRSSTTRSSSSAIIRWPARCASHDQPRGSRRRPARVELARADVRSAQRRDRHRARPRRRRAASGRRHPLTGSATGDQQRTRERSEHSRRQVRFRRERSKRSGDQSRPTRNGTECIR